MKQLNFQLKQLCKGNPTGSYSTQSVRHKNLQMIANQLQEMGYRGLQAKSIKPKHVNALLERWKAEEIGTGTIKNRMSYIRFWAKNVGKPGVVHSNNDEYGKKDGIDIGKRKFVTNVSKAKELSLDKLGMITDEGTKYSLRLQKEFGLRREESIKFMVSYADQGDHIKLKSSWTKGGKSRVIPVKTEEQRKLLNEVRKFSGNSSLIPSNKKYVQQMKTYERQTEKVELHKMHGLRHAYAQDRYKVITGRESPAAGGRITKFLTENEKVEDKIARAVISKELGHERLEVVAVYLGS